MLAAVDPFELDLVAESFDETLRRAAFVDFVPPDAFVVALRAGGSRQAARDLLDQLAARGLHLVRGSSR